MRTILEEYGDLIVAILGGVTVFAIIAALLPTIGSFVSEILNMLMGVA